MCKQLFRALLLVIASAGITGFTTYAYCQHQVSTYFDVGSIETETTEDIAVHQTNQKKVTVEMGIILPDKLLTGDPEKDWLLAQSFFSKEQTLTRHKTGTLPGITGYTGFSFKCFVPTQ